MLDLFSDFKFTLIYYQHLYLDSGEKINSPLNDDLRI